MKPSRRDVTYHAWLAIVGAVFVLTSMAPTVMYRLGQAARWTRWLLSEDGRNR